MTGQYGFRTGVLNFSGMRAGPPVKHEGAPNQKNDPDARHAKREGKWTGKEQEQ